MSASSATLARQESQQDPDELPSTDDEQLAEHQGDSGHVSPARAHVHARRLVRGTTE